MVLLLLPRQMFTQRLPRLSRAPCEEEEEEGAAPGRGDSAAREYGAVRPAAVK